MIHQPKSPNYPIYKLVDEYLIDGDQKIIAMDLGVSPSTVSRVKCGRVRSARVWKHIIELTMKRKKDQDQYVRIMKKETT